MRGKITILVGFVAIAGGAGLAPARILSRMPPHCPGRTAGGEAMAGETMPGDTVSGATAPAGRSPPARAAKTINLREDTVTRNEASGTASPATGRLDVDIAPFHGIGIGVWLEQTERSVERWRAIGAGQGKRQGESRCRATGPVNPKGRRLKPGSLRTHR